MIRQPPHLTKASSSLAEILKEAPDQVDEYMQFYSPLDKKGRYLHYHKFRFKLPRGINPVWAWGLTRLARENQLLPMMKLDNEEALYGCKFMLTPSIQKATSETDRNTTNAALEWMTNNIGENNHFEYLLKDLIEDEAISSSQLEGAATTTKAAKSLLKRKKKPRNPDEKMIIGNYKMMLCAWESRHEPLSLDLILKLHNEGVEGINDEYYRPGQFRSEDDVVVENSEGEIIHQPPRASGLESRLNLLTEWVNACCHHDANSQDYLHPLVKAIALHFAIGYEHPFRDGNGRVARSLFYWYLFKNDFSAFRYISISVLLKKSPAKYVRSYLYTETDMMDLTYFIDFQSRIILRAIKAYKATYQKILEDNNSFNSWLWKIGLLKKLTDKQQILFQVAKDGTAQVFTATNTAENLGCSYNTAARALNGLVKLGLFATKKDGRESVYFLLDQDAIKQRWQAA